VLIARWRRQRAADVEGMLLDAHHHLETVTELVGVVHDGYPEVRDA
jgi:hypothetical protein